MAIFFHGGVFCFCFSCMRCFILIAMLCACGSNRFKPPNFLLRTIVFLAMVSRSFLQIYWKILFCMLKVVFVSIGKMLLKNVFESMSVFANITLPFRGRILGESLFICFSIMQLLFANLCCLRIVNLHWNRFPVFLYFRFGLSLWFQLVSLWWYLCLLVVQSFFLG